MHVVDLGQCVAHAGTDGFACPLDVVTESSAASAEACGHGETVSQRIPFAVKLLDSPVVTEFLGVLYFLAEGGQSRFEPRLCRVVEHRVGPGTGDVVPDQGVDMDVRTIRTAMVGAPYPQPTWSTVPPAAKAAATPVISPIVASISSAGTAIRVKTSVPCQ